MTMFFILTGVIVLFYTISYLCFINTNDVYYDICDINEQVKVIKKGYLFCKIAYTHKEPTKILTLEFLLRFTSL